MSLFEPWLLKWNLAVDGAPFASLNGHLLPVRANGQPALIKLSHEPEEQAGSLLMAWWRGEGAAPVLAHEGEALLMARATGTRSLAEMARGDQDDTATRILCHVVQRLHAPRGRPPPAVVPLSRWFEPLWASARARTGVFDLAAASARALLESPRDVAVLHGDIHHGNVLDFGESGWLAIDPKGLHGERVFDYANIVCNPDPDSASRPGRFERRIEIIASTAGIDRRRLLHWVLAWAGLSATWKLEDRLPAEGALAIAGLAAAALGRAA